MKIVLLAMIVSLSVAAEQPKELYMPNESGGYIVLTVQPCEISEASLSGFTSRAYATESDSERPVTHEGCWTSPDISEAPKIRGVKIIPLVNLWFDGDIITFPQSHFGPEKRRWDTIPPSTMIPNV